MSDGADDLDRAADLTRKLEEAALVEVRRAAAPQQVQNSDGTWPNPYCSECEAELSTFRLSLGRIRCVECQEALEKGRRTYR